MRSAEAVDPDGQEVHTRDAEEVEVWMCVKAWHSQETPSAEATDPDGQERQEALAKLKYCVEWSQGNEKESRTRVEKTISRQVDGRALIRKKN